MDRFVLCPLLDGYNFAPGQNVMEQHRGIGMPRQRAFAIGVPHQVSASVLCSTELEQKYFWAFWRHKQRKPGRFLWAIKTDNFELEDHECQFSVSTPQVQQLGGKHIRINFNIWVKPLHRDAVMDQTIVEYYSSGFNPNISNLLEHLVNVVMPENLQ